MRITIAVALLVLLGATIALFAKLSSPGTALDSPPTRGVHEADPSTPGGTDESSGIAATTPESGGSGRIPLSSSQQAWVVRGEVRSSDGGICPAARFRAELHQGYETDGEPARSEELRADTGGRFTWALPRPGGTVTLRFIASHPDWLVKTQQRLVIRSRPAPEDIILYANANDAWIEGRVTNLDGRPVPGARIRAAGRSSTVICDERGHYETRVSSRSRHLMVEAGAPGFARIRRILEPPEAGTRMEVDFELHPGLHIRGRTVDEDGRPVEGVEVRTFYTASWTSSVTEKDGRFELDQCEPGRTFHMVFASRQGYADTRADLRTDAIPDELVLVMKGGARIEGRVVDPDGRPVPGAGLYIGFDRTAFDRLDAVAGDDGGFVFPCVGTGRHDLVAEVSGFAPFLHPLDVPEDHSRPIRLEVRLRPGLGLSGRTVGEDGRPIPGVRVGARTSGGGLTHSIGASVHTDSEGRFRLGDLPEGRVDLEFWSKGFVRHRLPSVTTGTKDLEVLLKRAASLAGKVVDAATGKPVPRFRIRFLESDSYGYSATWVREGQGFEREDGYWDTGDEPLVPGSRFVVEASATGYGPFTLELHPEQEPDPEAHVFALGPACRIVGRVVSSDGGAPVSGARLVLGTERNPIRPDFPEDFHGRAEARTDANGRFTLDGAPEGTCTLAVHHDAWPWQLDGPFEVGGPRDSERLIQLRPFARISGRVLDDRGLPIPDVEVRVLGGDAAARGLATRTDEQGRYTLHQGVGAGACVLAVVAGPVAGVTLVIGGATTTRLGESINLDLRPLGRCELRGTIEDRSEGGGAVSLSLLPQSWPDPMPEGAQRCNMFAWISGDRFHLRGLPAGTCRIFAGQGTLHAALQVELSEAKPGSCKVRLLDRSGR